MVHPTGEGLTTLPTFLLEALTTIEFLPNGQVTADYQTAEAISQKILESIRTEQIGYSALGCAIALARLANPDQRLTPQIEVQFVGDLMEWVGLYFDAKDTGVVH